MELTAKRQRNITAYRVGVSLPNAALMSDIIKTVTYGM